MYYIRTTALEQVPVTLRLRVTEVDECRKTYDGGKSGPCGVNADCVNTAGSYQCVCRDGYTGDGLMCTRTLYRVTSSPS